MFDILKNQQRNTPTSFSWSNEVRRLRAEMKVLVSGVQWCLMIADDVVARGFVPWQRSVLWYTTGQRGDNEGDFEVTLRKAAAYIERRLIDLTTDAT